MFRYCTGLVSFCGLYVLQNVVYQFLLYVLIFSVQIKCFSFVRSRCDKNLPCAIILFAISFKEVLPAFATGNFITKKQRRYFCCNTTGSGGKHVIFRLACFGGVAYCLKNWSFADGLLSVYLWERNPPLVFAVLGATSISEHAFLFVATDNPARKHSYFSQ